MIEINDNLFDQLVEEARSSKRKRKNHNFHTVASDPLQRMIHAMEPETYVQPHKHIDPDKREVFLVFRGKIAAIEYKEDGSVEQWKVLDASAGIHGVEMTPRKWHSLIALETGTVIYEVKDGPYDQSDDKCYADWAPNEGMTDGEAFNRKVLQSIGWQKQKKT